MVSQEEVIRAFKNFENEPRRASNFRMEVMDDGYTAYLIGGGDAVYAKREPLSNITVYDQHFRWPVNDMDLSCRMGALENQHHRVRRNINGPDANRVRHLPEPPQPTSEFDDLNGS